MTQLILDHAAMTATPPAKDHDLGRGPASSSGAQGDSLRAPILSTSGVA